MSTSLFTPPVMSRVDAVGRWLAPLGLRVLLAWEFYESGREKLFGDNWFAELGDKFPFPFSLLGPDLNWTLATGVELFAGAALLLGLGTRYISFALWVLTIVAVYAVHWPAEWSSLGELWQGYAITNQGFGNYKLPVLYLAMLLPLILNGAGYLSLDRLIASRRPPAPVVSSDRSIWGLVLFAIGLPVLLLLPWVGGALVVAGVALMASTLRQRFLPSTGRAAAQNA